MSFDTDSFLSIAVPSGLSTRYTPIPVGEYPAVIHDVKLRRTNNGSVILEVMWDLQAPDIQEKLNMKELRARQSIFLDFDASKNPPGLDMSENKNVQLGRLLEAVGRREQGLPSFNQLIGLGPCKVSVTHRPNQDDPTQVFAEIKTAVRM